MSNLILPTQLTGAAIPRFPEHDLACQALCRLRDKYSSTSLEYKALDAMSETVNRIGGRITTESGVRLIDNTRDTRKLASEGIQALVHYLTPGEVTARRSRKGNA